MLVVAERLSEFFSCHKGPITKKKILRSRNTMKKTILTLSAIAATALAAQAQTTVFSDNFSASQGTNYTTAGTIGTSSWTVSRGSISTQETGADWGARIDNGVLQLNNDVSTSFTNANGWVYAYQTLASTNDFSTIFSSSAGAMTWTFNMQQIRPNPAGFGTNSYGAAWIVGASSTLVATQGSGYAIVLGNTGAPDPLRFVSFTGGLQTLGTTTNALISATTPLNHPTNSYMSVQLTYDPTSDLWELFGRNDGTTSFSDPNVGTLDSLGSVIDSTYTGTELTSSGAYWQGSTAGNQFAQFGNASLEVVPEPSTYALLALSAAGFAGYVIRRRRR